MIYCIRNDNRSSITLLSYVRFLEVLIFLTDILDTKLPGVIVFCVVNEHIQLVIYSGHPVQPCVVTTPSTMSPPLLASLPRGNPIFGIACIRSHLYLVRQHTPELEKYSVTTTSYVSDQQFFQLVARIPVPGLRNPNDLAACPLSDSIYVLDCLQPTSFVYRLPATTPSNVPVASWPTGDRMAVKLSVTGTGSVLVVYPGVRKVREFSPDGRMTDDVDLNPELANPWHAVRLNSTSRSLLVCHGDKTDRLHRVCLLEIIGSKDSRCATKLAQVYGGVKGPADRGLLSVPSHVAVSSSERRGLVFVTDVNNGRVAQLDLSLRHIRDFVVRRIDCPSTGADSRGPMERSPRWYPIRVCLDEPDGLLFVSCAERAGKTWKAGTVAVFRII